MARVVLVAGEARVAGAGRLGLGEMIRAGQVISVGKGQAVVVFPRGSSVLIGPATRVALASATPDRIALGLVTGQIFARVTPRRAGGMFTVKTAQGRVVVVGTAFSVDQEEARVTVRVFRGQVRVEPPEGPPLRVDAGKELRLPGTSVPAGRASRGWPGQTSGRDGHLAPIPLSESMTWMRAERLLALMAPRGGGRSTALHVYARPAGVQVLLDGVWMGPAPVAVMLASGQRHITLRRRGRTAIREEVSLPAGGEVMRRFDLGREGSAGRPPDPARDRAGSRPASSASAAASPVTPAPAMAPSDIAGRSTTRISRPKGARLARPGHAFSPGTRSRAVARTSPAPEPAPDLLRRARQRRAARDYPAAVRIYEGILRYYPESAEAQVALISLGILRMGPQWSPRAALALFNQYLARFPSGGLCLEARFGKARALRALGRRAEEIHALEDLLRHHPHSVQAGAARSRLQRLVAATKGPGASSPPGRRDPRQPPPRPRTRSPRP